MKNYGFILWGFFISLIMFSFYQDNSGKQNSTLMAQIDSIRVHHSIPAVSFGVIRNDSVILSSTVGYRSIETKAIAETGDLFHIGSNTKSFTSFIAAKSVEDKLISWDTKFFDLFPELKHESNSGYVDINLKELLSHRAHLIGFKDSSEVYPIVDYEKNISDVLGLPEKRYEFIKQVLKYDPVPLYEHPDDRYSNAGYIAAAIMLEKATGKSWEDLINKMSETLDLGLHIGWPDDVNPDQPIGHINPKDWVLDIDKELIPLPPVLKKYHYFNQFMLLCRPSGHLSITLPGFLEYLRLNINGLDGQGNYLKPETYKELFYTYPDYSCGWMHEKYFIPCFHHKGSAGTFNSIAIIVPEKKIGIVIMINVANGDAINELAELLIKKYAG
jgi:D-alanyl-D-alanine carboxypeptidase